MLTRSKIRSSREGVAMHWSLISCVAARKVLNYDWLLQAGREREEAEDTNARRTRHQSITASQLCFPKLITSIWLWTSLYLRAKGQLSSFKTWLLPPDPDLYRLLRLGINNLGSRFLPTAETGRSRILHRLVRNGLDDSGKDSKTGRQITRVHGTLKNIWNQEGGGGKVWK